MLDLLKTFSWQELRQHPWRSAAAVLSVLLGVALAFSVHLINASALSEFTGAVRSISGQPDLQLRAAQGDFDEALFGRVATDARVRAAAPVLEFDTVALEPDGARRSVTVLGIDALVMPQFAPALMPQLGDGADRLAMLAPRSVFLNTAAQQVLLSKAASAGLAQIAGGTVRLQSGLALQDVTVAGSVAAGGAPLVVLDIAAAQELFDRLGRLSRIDVKLEPGVDRAAFLRELALPAGVSAVQPDASGERADNLSRAYRVNLTVLALVALFTGAFLVYSVLSLSVAKRAQQFALLGVLGATGPERLRLVLAESLLLGVLGSVLGLALGTGLAALALRVLGGDLGGGYFPGVAPQLQWGLGAALAYGALGVAAALVGGWLPARAVQRMVPAQALKGFSSGTGASRWRWVGPTLIVASVLLALTPPLFGIPVAAYISVALLLVGGIVTLPLLIALIYAPLSRWVAQRALPMLAVERARRVRESAAVAVSGVVASLALAVALTVMVASFRDSVTRWLDVVLPADLYIRSARSSAGAETAFFADDFVQATAALPGVARAEPSRSRVLQLDESLPAVSLIARGGTDLTRSLPLVDRALTAPEGTIAVYVSEPMEALYGARPGLEFPRLLKAFLPGAATSTSKSATFFVAGVWRDYSRQFGAVVLDRADYVRLTGDERINEMQITVQPGTDLNRLQQEIRALTQRPKTPVGAAAETNTDARTNGASNAAAGVAVDAGANGASASDPSADLLDFASASELRTVSLRIFDRSFAVTYWLQAVAIGIGLFGVAASFSAQVLARRKEFGLLAHLGLTRGQILAVVAGEGAAWTGIGALAGLALGLAVSVVLVHVVNPQSFHWTMDLLLPWPRLFALCAAVVLAGTATAWIAGRAAAGRDAVLAVKEDW
ncbi:MAG: ABC transporter permease [Burkholderiaceae bacterium]